MTEVNSYSPVLRRVTLLSGIVGAPGDVRCPGLASHIQGPVCFFILALLPQEGQSPISFLSPVPLPQPQWRPWGMENSQEWGAGVRHGKGSGQCGRLFQRTARDVDLRGGRDFAGGANPRALGFDP